MISEPRRAPLLVMRERDVCARCDAPVGREEYHVQVDGQCVRVRLTLWRVGGELQARAEVLS